MMIIKSALVRETGLRSILLFLILNMSGTASGVALNIVPAHIEAGVSETFIVSIDVDPNSNNIYGVEFCLLYDQSLLEGIEVEKGQFLRQDGVQTGPVYEIDNSIGKIHYAETRTGSTGVGKPGSIAVITFRVNGNAESGSIQTFTLKNVTIKDHLQKQLPVELNEGDFRVTGETRARIQKSMPEEKISRELSDTMNETNDIEKISVKISVDEKDSVQNLLNFLNSRGTEVSDMNLLDDFITARVSKRLILEISSIPFVTQITPFKEATKPEEQPGFGIMITVVIVALTYLRFKE